MINYAQSPKASLTITKLAVFLLVGPLLSLQAFNHYLLPKLTTYDYSVARLMLVLLWSPIFFALPAILMQKSRDAALPQYSGVVGNAVRGAKLLPYLIAQRNTHSIETIASLAGWVVLIIFLF